MKAIKSLKSGKKLESTKVDNNETTKQNYENKTYTKGIKCFKIRVSMLSYMPFSPSFIAYFTKSTVFDHIQG